MVKIGELKEHLATHLNPMVWQRIQIKLLPSFRKKGFYFHTMTDEKDLDKELIAEISKSLNEMYNVQLPTNFLNDI